MHLVSNSADPLGDRDFVTLATFRHELRRFLRFSEIAAEKAGLTAQQHQALLAIRAAPACAMLVGELAERLMLQPHSTTGLVDRLERLELVERAVEADDRRRVRVALTRKGVALMASLAESHRAELRRLRPLLGDLLARL
jgi:DNA-binding MarR family transcriptional regulator